ncbi:MAG TPA: Rieske 2Fe-2S domain-containing protein [Candidatus Thermoplasmatota archaeon]|nr:Rieske 2Fe-2S domain-containing protein [Candidatus Thermoplasmatota archaeon]
MTEVSAGPLARIPEGGCVLVEHGPWLLAVWKIGGAPHAADAVCPHRGGPLHEGTLEGAVVTCPLHAFRFDVRTGRNPFNPGSRIAVFPARVTPDGEVLVDVPA